jgi:biopolymer transport protein ExbD
MKGKAFKSRLFKPVLRTAFIRARDRGRRVDFGRARSPLSVLPVIVIFLALLLVIPGISTLRAHWLGLFRPVERIPRATFAEELEPGPTLTLSAGTVVFENKRLGTLQNLLDFDDDQIVTRNLQRQLLDFKRCAIFPQYVPDVVIVADADLPYAALRKVMQAARQVGYMKFQLAVLPVPY